jgi:uncharacterized Zn-binding protein involved in type VI secretion
MGKPAARLNDMHVCPMVTPGVPPVPHVGGPIVGPGMPTVMIGGVPAAVVGDMCVCTGPPDSIILGSLGVLIGGKPAARMGDTTAHGGSIVLGLPTVLIGDICPGVPPMAIVMANQVISNLPPASQGPAKQIVTLVESAQKGTPFCEKCTTVYQKEDWIEIHLFDKEGNPLANEDYKLEFPDGTDQTGTTNSDGVVEIHRTDPGNCKISFPKIESDKWEDK